MGLSDLDWLTTTIDCGDNSCLFKDTSKPGGMRTNGGCRCFSMLPTTKRIFVNKMLFTILLLQREICSTVSADEKECLEYMKKRNWSCFEEEDLDGGY